MGSRYALTLQSLDLEYFTLAEEIHFTVLHITRRKRERRRDQMNVIRDQYSHPYPF